MHYSALTDEDAVSLAHAIGDWVRHERQARRWTLDQLAEAAGTSRRSVINVEQGTANPSVGTLLKLSDALGVGLPALVAPPEPKPLAVTRAGQAAELWTGRYGGRGCLVAGTRPPDVVELWDWTLNPGDAHSSEPHAEGTHELIHVLAGAIRIEVGDEALELGEGDAVSFPGDLAHTSATPHDAPARFSLAVFEPGVGLASRTEPRHV